MEVKGHFTLEKRASDTQWIWWLAP